MTEQQLRRAAYVVFGLITLIGAPMFVAQLALAASGSGTIASMFFAVTFWGVFWLVLRADPDRRPPNTN